MHLHKGVVHPCTTPPSASFTETPLVLVSKMGVPLIEPMVISAAACTHQYEFLWHHSKVATGPSGKDVQENTCWHEREQTDCRYVKLLYLQPSAHERISLGPC